MSDCVERLTAGEVLALCVLGLLVVGVLAVESAAQDVGAAAAVDALRLSGSGAKHALLAGLAVIVFWAGSRLPARWVGQGWVGPAAVLVAAAALVAVLVPGVGLSVNGARRWLPLPGGVVLQASELGKWAAVAWLAWRCPRPGALSDLRGFVVTGLPVAGICLLVVIEDFGTAALIAVAALAVLLAAGAKLWHLLLAAGPAAGAGYLFVAGTPYRWGRMTSFLDPWADPEGKGFHMIQSLLSFAGGGPTGRGLGLGVQKLGYLPEDTTDFVFATWCEETGIFGAAVVVGLYLGVLAACWRAVRRAGDPHVRLLALSVGVVVGLQATINLAVATVSVPTKGMSLPLISAGGSGLLLTALMLGLLASTLSPTAAATAATTPEADA